MRAYVHLLDVEGLIALSCSPPLDWGRRPCCSLLVTTTNTTTTIANTNTTMSIMTPLCCWGSRTGSRTSKPVSPP